MELRYRREAAVGFLLIIGTLTFVILMMWLRGKSFQAGEVVKVTFDDVAGLKEGDPVRTSGVAVGRIERIHLVSPGNVDVWLEIQTGPPPRADATARILSSDLFGARYVEYSPGTAAEPLPADAPLRGVRVQDMAEMAAALGDRSKALIDSVTLTTAAVSRELRATLQTTRILLATLDSGAARSSDRLVLALDELRRSLQRVDVLLAENGPVAGQALRGMRDASAHADSLTGSLARATAQLDSLLDLVHHGSGPLAAMVNDSTIIRDLMSTNAALRDLLVDLKANPGRYIRLRL